MDISHPLELVDEAGTVTAAVVVVSERDDEYGVGIRWPGREISASGDDAFSALCTLREQLTALGLTPRCYGACRNLVVSGMAAQMGGGLKGYLVRLGHQARMADMVDIFDAGTDMDLATVPQQREFTTAWYRSLGLSV
jgi:hypothetical protein